jgi:hypothetical protein
MWLGDHPVSSSEESVVARLATGAVSQLAAQPAVRVGEQASQRASVPVSPLAETAPAVQGVLAVEKALAAAADWALEVVSVFRWQVLVLVSVVMGRLEAPAGCARFLELSEQGYPQWQASA